VNIQSHNNNSTLHLLNIDELSVDE